MFRVASSMMPTLSSVSRVDLVDAMWRDDHDYLERVAPCGCCCNEHYWQGCPARAWFGCRGSFSTYHEDHDAAAWATFYARTRGMSKQAFYAYLDAEAAGDARRMAAWAF